ncbi:hypothetical protein [Marinobacter alkaliphilus]|uniref:Preprotein translocase subunit SecB n=1 Tax=Marinobacter alkaliphilus TaxID=254719 RepID=A0ABZ3E8K3_9GAMM
MSTKVYAYNYHLVENRFHRVLLDIPSYDGIDDSGGDLSIRTQLKFGLDSNNLYCTLSGTTTIIPSGKEAVDQSEETEITLEIAATAKFELPQNHGIDAKKLNNMTDDEVMSFSNVLDPLLVNKIRETLIDAGINGITLPLQLKPLRSDQEQTEA